MSSLVKSIFNFSNSKDKDSQIAARISKVEGLIRDMQKQMYQDLASKIKMTLNAVFKEQKGESLFELVYRTSVKQSAVEWVPVIGKIISLFDPNSTFMRIVLQSQDYRIPIQKYLIPNYLFRNNLLNEKSGYLNIAHSTSGMIVPLLDYVFIRLAHAIYQLDFIEIYKQPNEEFQSDDMYFYVSRNPYILLLRSYLQFFSNSDRNLKRLTANIKMYFVDEIIIKHRINKSSAYLKDFTVISSNYKIKPHYFLVIYLLLRKGRVCFEEKDLYFSQVIQRFYSLIQSQTQIFFRFLFRIFIFAYSKNSIETDVIDSLSKANVQEGYFQLARYSTSEFAQSLRSVQSKQRNQFSGNKTLLLKLLQKDFNLISGGRVHFSIIRTLGCFLRLQIALKPGSTYRLSAEESHRNNSETTSLELAICKIQRYTNNLLAKQKKEKRGDLTKRNMQLIEQETEQLSTLYFEVYGRRIDTKKLEDLRDSNLDRAFNIRGQNADYTYSIETYKKDIQQNCWKVPLKDSQFQFLYDIFYGLARRIDRVIPGIKSGEYPRTNLRYFCNPIIFMLTCIIIIVLIRISF